MSQEPTHSRGRAARAPLGWAMLLLAAALPLFAADFAGIEPLLREHCVECHMAQEPEGGLVLESHEALLKGGESGPVVVPGKAAESLLVKALEGNWGKTGKNQFMPPGKREKLKPEQVALFKAWINAGAPAATAAAAPRELNVPKITPTAPPRRPVNALAFASSARLLAVARPDAVELVDADTRAVRHTLTGFRGAANAAVFSADGEFVFAGAGDATGGEVRQWRVRDGSPVRTFGGHRDAVFAVAVSADGSTLATGGYDYAIQLWSLAGEAPARPITANQGAVMGLAFRPDGRLLASASFDRTAKLFEVAAGTRLETFGQALKELNAVAFSPDGRTLLTGGNDNRLRAYRIGADGKEGSNELLATVFAHEGAILRLAFSPDGRAVASAADDRTVKLFDAAELKPVRTLETQPDWPTALAFTGNDTLAVGRADGSLAFYATADGKPAAPPKPELIRAEPRGVQRGFAHRVKLVGQHLAGAGAVLVHRDRLLAAIAPEPGDDGLWVALDVRADEPPGPLELSVADAHGESGRVQVWVDDLPQWTAPERTTNAPASATVVLPALPVSVWGTLAQPGQSPEFTFDARAGQTLVFDLASQRLGAKGDLHLTLLDAAGRILAENDSFTGQNDPLLVHRFGADGTHRVRVGETTYGGSPDHFFRLSMGELPLVLGVFPLAVPAGAGSALELSGANLPEAGRLDVAAGAPGELPLPRPATWRTRRDWNLDVTGAPAPIESEPNDSPAQAMSVPVPVSVNGRLAPAQDADLFRFPAHKGVTYVLEAVAATRGSPADTRLEVQWPDGRPVERLRLAAVRNSAITFRPETSDDPGIRFDNYEEMELNDLLWCGGEVMKIFRHAQGPDSDLLLYTGGGKRRGYFDTTPTAHYLDEPVYVVVPLAPGEEPFPNGLPRFALNYENEDAAARDLGTDSRLHFTAPADGGFLARVTDARGFGGPDFAYALTIREARPDFTVTLNGASPAVAPGSGQSFNVALRRLDGFDGPVRIEFNHLPAGWTVSNPLPIEAGHNVATGTLNAPTNAAPPTDAEWDAVTAVATAVVEGRAVALAVGNLGRPKLAPEPAKLRLTLSAVDEAGNAVPGAVLLQPGTTTKVKLGVTRHDFEDVVQFDIENLPHGVIVDNLGLNGITFLEGENERILFLACARWVGELERPIHAVETAVGRQTSPPVMLKVTPGTLRAAK